MDVLRFGRVSKGCGVQVGRGHAQERAQSADHGFNKKNAPNSIGIPVIKEYCFIEQY